eukprot:6326529-Prymnesium_polylepis.1
MADDARPSVAFEASEPSSPNPRRSLLDLAVSRRSMAKQATAALETARDSLKKIPVTLRLTVCLGTWFVVAFAGAAIFHSLECAQEQATAAARSERMQSAGVGPMSAEAAATEAAAEAAGYKPRAPAASGNGSSGIGLDHRRNVTAQYDMLFDLYKELRATCKQVPSERGAEHWTFAGSLYFALQTMTTIGYGTFAPETTGGHTAVIVFGSFGIIFSAFCLGVFSATFDECLEALYVRWSRKKAEAPIMFKLVCTVVLLALYLCAVAVYASLVNSWRYGISLYFVFVSVSTIGLGDYAMDDDTVGRVVLNFALFFPGLVLFSEFVNLGTEAAHRADARAQDKAVVLTHHARRRLTGKLRTGGLIAGGGHRSARMSARARAASSETAAEPHTPVLAGKEGAPRGDVAGYLSSVSL